MRQSRPLAGGLLEPDGVHGACRATRLVGRHRSQQQVLERAARIDWSGKAERQFADQATAARWIDDAGYPYPISRAGAESVIEGAADLVGGQLAAGVLDE